MKRKNKTEEKTIDKEKPPILRIRASHQQILEFKELGGAARPLSIEKTLRLRCFCFQMPLSLLKHGASENGMCE